MDLKVSAAGEEVIVPEGTTAVTIRLARPGISRRHAVVKYTDSHWVVQDASSRNGTFHNGTRVQTVDLKGPTTIRLGHPTEGAEVVLVPSNAAGTVAPTTRPADPVTPPAAARTRVTPTTSAAAPGSVDPRLDELVASLNDTVKSIKGLTWSVWAMIAVTAVLALLTLFVGIIGN